MEVELVALETSTIEVEWLKDLLMDSSLVDKSVLVILLQCDNQSVIIIVGNAKENLKFSKTCEIGESNQ
jgi:hypothetical protein